MQGALVQQFFDGIAADYPERFLPENRFHHYLFLQRLHAACEGLDLDGARLLDVGAGTGALYDYLMEKGLRPDYYACDLSAKMLDRSNIPTGRHEAGALSQTSYARQRFDYVFGLGLTTYLLPAALQELLEQCADMLRPGGCAVLSFTNKYSLDWKLRRTLLPAVRLAKPGRHVWGQAFQVNAWTPEEAASMLPPALSIRRQRWLTPCIPLLSRFCPQIGIPLANQLASKHLYSDFLLFMQRL